MENVTFSLRLHEERFNGLSSQTHLNLASFYYISLVSVMFFSFIKENVWNGLWMDGCDFIILMYAHDALPIKSLIKKQKEFENNRSRKSTNS